MKWQQLLAWSTEKAGEYAFIVAKNHPRPADLISQSSYYLAQHESDWDQMSEDEKSAKAIAVAWRAAQIMSTEYRELGSGWEESFANTLYQIHMDQEGAA